MLGTKQKDCWMKALSEGVPVPVGFKHFKHFGEGGSDCTIVSPTKLYELSQVVVNVVRNARPRILPRDASYYLHVSERVLKWNLTCNEQDV